MSYLRTLAGDTVIYGLGYIIPRILNYLLIAVYLTWKFEGEQAEYGLYNDFYFYVALLLVLLTLRMETTFFRFGSKDGMRGKAFSSAAITLICTALFWAIIVVTRHDSIAELMEYPGYGRHVMVLGVIISLDILVAIPFAALRLDHRPRRFALLKTLGVVINVAFVLFFLEICPALKAQGLEAFAFYSHDNRLYYVFLANLIASSSIFLLLMPQYRRLHFHWDPTIWKRMMVYTLPLVVVGLAGVINQSSYITFQKYILPNSITENLSNGGIYAAATKLAILMNLFTVAFNYAAEPFFFHNAEHRDAKNIYANVARAFTIAASLLFLFILLYIDIIQLMLGRSFREGIYVVPILLMAFLFLGLYYNVSIWYKVKDKTHVGAFISLGGALITVILNIVLIRKMEVVGSAWASLACYGFMCVACYALGRKYYPVPYNVPRILSIITLALTFYGLSLAAQAFFQGSMLQTIAVNTVILAIFLLIVYRLEGKFLKGLWVLPMS